MHEILAHESTFFKCTRTARFFISRFPEIETAQRTYRDYLAGRIERLSSAEYQLLISRMDVAPRGDDRTGAANKLAWDIARVQAVHGSEPGDDDLPSVDDYFNTPISALDSLYRYKLLEVSPHSGALGCEMLVPYQHIRRVLPDAPPRELLVMDNVVHPDISAYLAEVYLQAIPAELQATEYWNRLSITVRRQILDDLQEDLPDRESAEIERDLRLRIARLNSDVTLDEIRELVQNDVKSAEKYGEIVSAGYTTANSMFAGYVEKTLAASGVPENIAWLLGFNQLTVGELKKKDAKKLLEAAFPRIRVANYVRARKK